MSFLRPLLRLADCWVVAGFDFSSEGPEDGLCASVVCIADGIESESYPALDMAVSARLPFLRRRVADGACVGGSGASTFARLGRLAVEERAGSRSSG